MKQKFRLNPLWRRYGFLIDTTDNKAEEKAKLYDMFCSYLLTHPSQEYIYLSGNLTIEQLRKDAIKWNNEMVEMYKTETEGGNQRAQS